MAFRKFTMTKAEALKIQADQLDHYCTYLTAEQASELRRRIAAKTHDQLLPDGESDVAAINEHIPRGVCIEQESAAVRGVKWQDMGD